MTRDSRATSDQGREWPWWLGVAAVDIAFAVALVRWGEVAFHVFMVMSAAASGAFIGFWLAAEWTNVDDRDTVGDPFPVMAIAAGTGIGAAVAGGVVLLGTLRWG